LTYVLNWLLLIAMMLEIVSGIMISEAVLPALWAGPPAGALRRR